MRARRLGRFHFHDHALHVREWDSSAAFVADEIGLLADDLVKATAALDAKIGMRNEGQARHCLILQNVQSQHPPHQEQRDHCHDDVADELPGGLRFGAIGHEVIVAGWLMVENKVR